jgi:hypothetical protein
VWVLCFCAFSIPHESEITLKKVRTNCKESMKKLCGVPKKTTARLMLAMRKNDGGKLPIANKNELTI